MQRLQASDSRNYLRKTCAQNMDVPGKNLMDLRVPRNVEIFKVFEQDSANSRRAVRII